jgi:hypothetical protein
MKKLFSLVALTGMFMLMSFSLSANNLEKRIVIEINKTIEQQDVIIAIQNSEETELPLCFYIGQMVFEAYGESPETVALTNLLCSML